MRGRWRKRFRKLAGVRRLDYFSSADKAPQAYIPAGLFAVDIDACIGGVNPLILWTFVYGKVLRSYMHRSAVALHFCMVYIRPRTATKGKEGRQSLPATIRHDIFAREFVKDFHGKDAAIRCGANPRTAVFTAANLLQRPNVREMIERLVSERRERLDIAADDIGRYWLKLATADPRELCPVVVACCRYCYGVDHDYQYSVAEFRDAQRRHLRTQLKKKQEDRVPFDERGGSDYDFTKPPVEDCPECRGRGINRPVPVDIQALSEGAQLLFDGYKYTKDGVEIKFRDRSRAMENLANMLGLNRSRPTRSFNFDDMSDDELDAAIESAMRRRLLNPGEIIDA